MSTGCPAPYQTGHTNRETIVGRYARRSRRPERVGTLAHELSAKSPSKKPEISQKMATAEAAKTSQVADSKRESSGAGGQGRTGDVQLGKLAFYR